MSANRKQVNAVLRRVLDRKRQNEARVRALALAAEEEAEELQRAAADLDLPSYADPPFACPPDEAK
jgi:hypothetical protein